MLNFRTIGTGQPLLILHGVTLDHHYMMDIIEPVIEQLEGWQSVYVDLPGHGRSPAYDTISSQDDLLSAIKAFADEMFQDQPFGLIGQSRGSYLARGLVYLIPDRVTGAALIVPGGNPSSDPERLPAHRVLVAEPSLKPEVSEAELWGFENMSVVQSREILEKWRRIIAPAETLFDAEQEARVWEKFDFSFHAEMEQTVFHKPSLIVAGRQDGFSGYLDAIDLQANFPRASLSVLDTAGHALPWERPEAFKALLQDWLHRLEADQSKTRE